MVGEGEGRTIREIRWTMVIEEEQYKREEGESRLEQSASTYSSEHEYDHAINIRSGIHCCVT